MALQRQWGRAKLTFERAEPIVQALGSGAASPPVSFRETHLIARFPDKAAKIMHKFLAAAGSLFHGNLYGSVALEDGRTLSLHDGYAD